MYFYKAKLIRVVDSDTVDAEIDLGFDLSIRQRIRLYGVLTPNSRSQDLDEKELGLAAKGKLIEVLPKEFYVETILNKRGKYGRVLGTVYQKSDDKYISINQLLIDEGYAQAHQGFSKE
jgi:endonuclease YncB( thermonuclease family)